jgi:hypothetical protein
VASLVPPLGTGRWGGDAGGKDDGPLNGAARAAAVVGGLSGCLDPVANESYGGSRAIREEKTTRRRNREPTRSPVQAR